VLENTAQGRTNAAIADELSLSDSSMEKHATSIFAKLRLRDEPQTHRRVAEMLAVLRDAGRAQPCTGTGLRGRRHEDFSRACTEARRHRRAA
jgi:hypothetical protein